MPSLGVPGWRQTDGKTRLTFVYSSHGGKWKLLHDGMGGAPEIPGMLRRSHLQTVANQCDALAYQQRAFVMRRQNELLLRAIGRCPASQIDEHKQGYPKIRN